MASKTVVGAEFNNCNIILVTIRFIKKNFDLLYSVQKNISKFRKTFKNVEYLIDLCIYLCFMFSYYFYKILNK